MTTFISRVLPSSVAVRPKIGLAQKFKNVDDKKHTPFYPSSQLFFLIAASIYFLFPSEHWPVCKICES
jgi:hypothetical protein